MINGSDDIPNRLSTKGGYEALHNPYAILIKQKICEDSSFFDKEGFGMRLQYMRKTSVWELIITAVTYAKAGFLFPPEN